MLETLIRHLDMVRLTLGAVTAAVLFSGCVGFIGDPSDDGLTTNQRKARDLFVSKALPVMVTGCGSEGCHGAAVVPFLAGKSALDIYDVVKGFNPVLINTIDGAKSRLLTKGEHSGPAFSTAAREGQSSSDFEIVLEWLRAEQRAAGDAPPGQTGPTYIVSEKIRPVVCTGNRAACTPNKISLRGIRPDKTGVEADIEFLYEVLPASNTPYLVNLRLVGGPQGAYIESPIFLGYTAGKTSPTIDGDTFFDTKVNVPASMTKSIGSGYAGLTGIEALDAARQPNEIAMSFQIIDNYRPENQPTDPSTCKQLANWQTNVKPIMSARCSAGCHISTSANMTAKASMTIDAGNDAATCQQAKRAASNLNNIPSTALYNAPRMGVAAGHDFKFAVAADQTAWETAVTTWLTAEKNSP